MFECFVVLADKTLKDGSVEIDLFFMFGLLLCLDPGEEDGSKGVLLLLGWRLLAFGGGPA